MPDNNTVEFIPGVEILTGTILKNDVKRTQSLQQRDCMAKIKEYISKPTDKLFLITGLRGTGKTVLTRQVINELQSDEFNKTVMVNVLKGTAVNFSEITSLCEDLYDKGYRNFFINEATEARDLPKGVTYIQDALAHCGCHVVLTGTNSLSIEFVKKILDTYNDAENSYEEVRTTRIPYHEWKRLVTVHKENTVLQYMQFGGVLDLLGIPDNKVLGFKKHHSFADSESIEQYIYPAIACNLQNSIAKNEYGKNFGVLRSLYEANQLLPAIMQTVQLKNYPIAVDSLRNAFTIEKIASIKESLLAKYFHYIPLIRKHRKEIQQDIRNRLYRDKPATNVTPQEVNTILECLIEMDIFKVITVYTVQSGNNQNTEQFHKEKEILQTQIGIRYGHVQAALNSAWEIFCRYGIDISYDDFIFLAGFDARRHILEDLIVSEITDSIPENCFVTKISFNERDCGLVQQKNFDDTYVMAVNCSSGQLSLFSVCNFYETASTVSKIFNSNNVFNKLKSEFRCKNLSYRILYLGNTKYDGVQYENISEFLLGIGKKPKNLFL